MKRKVLVLDAFTNGHEAALAFIKRQGWEVAHCEIIFCGKHSNVFSRLAEGPAYAVVPIENSIAGEVKDVVRTIIEFREKGYDFKEEDRIVLQINHCLLASKHISKPEELEEVMSHEKAIQQCGKYLDKIGILPEKRIKSDSTGGAAKIVSRLGDGVKTGAIAPKAAAEEYGLKILAENIQDVLDNKTTFILLHNEARVQQVSVGIIGIRGHFGQMLEKFFTELGCIVIGSDEKNPAGFSNEDVVNHSDVILFSVPIKDTPAIIHSLLPKIKEDQLLMDVTSVKRPAIEEMLKSEAQVVGLHPMFRPEISFDGQTIVACPARLNHPFWKNWVVNMLSATKAKIKWSTAEEHDRYMTIVQALTHLANLTSALVIAENGTSVSESLGFTSPFYQVTFSLMGRLVSQNPGLYTSIIMENPETLNMLEKRIEIEQRLVEMIRTKDQESFEGLFIKARDHFGAEVTKEANELFMRIIGVFNTLCGNNSVTLEFSKVESRPGLLEKILKVFSERAINLTGINSVILGERLQFTISFEKSRASDEVRKALEEIENWSEPKVKVLS